MDLRKIFSLIPEVKKPEDKKVDFNVKLKWTLIVLISFFVLANISLFGLSENALSRFKYLAVILGTDFGSIISLGIGPIVMASIILQLLVGSGLMKIDISNKEGKRFYQGIQKLFVLFFILFEAVIYVAMGGLQALPGLSWLLILQLILGGILIYYMDDLTQKWGFGSGVSLFIGAGVSWRIFTELFQFIDVQGKNCLADFAGTPCAGKIFIILQSVTSGAPTELLAAVASIVSTVIIFLIVVWAQSLKVEIPLSFDRLRGYGIKWPLSFFYSSVMPVILISALIANVQLFAGMVENAAMPCFTDGGVCEGGAKIASNFVWLGRFQNGQPIEGMSFWISSTNLLELTIRGGFMLKFFLQGLIHILVFMALAIIFAIFWVKTSGMDAKAQAEKISASGLKVSGFRQDNRVLEAILDRYIMPLTIMGGAAIGLLASVTDLLGAIVGGTSILLVIMIMYQFFQSIIQQHQTDMNPLLRKFVGG